MKLISLLGHSAELLRIINKSPQPADRLAVEFFRAKKYIGASDRRFISSIVFSSLRNRSRNEMLCERAVKFEEKEFKLSKDFFTVVIQHWAQECFIKAEGRACDDFIKEINDFLEFKYSIKSKIDANFFDAIEKIYEEELEIFDQGDVAATLQAASIVFSFPQWAINKLFDKIPDINFIFALAKSFLNSAPLVLRVNRLTASRERVIEELLKLDVNARIDPLSPDGLIIDERARVIDTDLYKNGLIEVQDSASQLLAFALNPSENMKILDACAGAGGKSLHIATLQNDKGEIYSHDIEYQRLKEIKFRAERAGLKSINTSKPKAFADSKIDGKYPKQFDVVVIDAPCSGFGTLRRSPNIKWKMPERGFEKIVESQYKILCHYSQFVNLNGFLVYATCSIMPQENEENVKRFLSEYPEFQPVALEESFEHFGVKIKNLNSNDFYITLYPHIHNTDGFFIAKMKRIE